MKYVAPRQAQKQRSRELKNTYKVTYAANSYGYPHPKRVRRYRSWTLVDVTFQTSDQIRWLILADPPQTPPNVLHLIR